MVLKKWSNFSPPTSTVEDRCLCVEGIREGGAVEAWNRQCGIGPGNTPENGGPGGKAFVKKKGVCVCVCFNFGIPQTIPEESDNGSM